MARVVLENVRVDFPIYATQRNLRTAIFNRATGGLIQRQGKNQNRVVVTALSGVSMTLEDGDRVGLVGHNGSGKSTLLKVLAGIYEPIEGRLLVEGAVTPLFDMMPGLDPEDSGYENILTAGLLLGLSREEIESRLPQIEELSELGEYLSLPVRTYSAGMAMRLGFSLVTSLEPAILLMDEGIGTGDAHFVERAEQRLNELIGRSSIMVVASHSDKAIRTMCNKAVLMEAGRILAIGSVGEICEQYDALVRGGTKKVLGLSGVASALRGCPAEEDLPVRPIYSEVSIRNVSLDDRLKRTSGAVRMTRAHARDENGNVRWTYAPGETAKFCFDYEVLEPTPDLAFLFQLNFTPNDPDNHSKQIAAEICEILSSDALDVGDTGTFELTLPRIILTPNSYRLHVCLIRADGRVFYDVIGANVDLPTLVITPSSAKWFRYGVVSLEYKLLKSSNQKKALCANASS
jgi:ABC-type polysaccharide/polyol phosphate transport system ATPase subunit